MGAGTSGEERGIKGHKSKAKWKESQEACHRIRKINMCI